MGVKVNLACMNSPSGTEGGEKYKIIIIIEIAKFFEWILGQAFR